MHEPDVFTDSAQRMTLPALPFLCQLYQRCMQSLEVKEDSRRYSQMCWISAEDVQYRHVHFTHPTVVTHVHFNRLFDIFVDKGQVSFIPSSKHA